MSRAAENAPLGFRHEPNGPDYFEVHTPMRTVVSVVGRAPRHSPYVRIENRHGVYLGTIDGDDLVALRDAITRAIKGRNR